MGIPDYVTTGQRRDLFTFVDLNLSPMVDRGFHAMALDERRLDFPVTRWNADPRIEEVWFVGCHSDVGGGYPNAEAGLSDVALDWMMKKLNSVGVQFAAPLIHAPDVTRFVQPFHTPWKKPPFNIKPQARAPKPGDVFDPRSSSTGMATRTISRPGRACSERLLSARAAALSAPS